MHIRFQRIFRTGACAALLAAALAPFPAQAVKVMDLEADDMVRAAGHVKELMTLTPNQQTLWQQVASKSAAMLRIRQSRREKLQAELKTKLTDPRQELRDLAGAIEAESVASATEDKELRELWLTLNDALNDQQRQVAAQFMLTQLERVDAPSRGSAPEQGRGEAPQRGRHQKQEGGGGPQRF